MAKKQKNDSDIQRRSRLYSLAPIAELIKRQWIKPKTDSISEKAIKDFAQAHQRHPGIIVGRLQHDDLISYSNLRKYLVKVHSSLTNWIDN